MFAHYPLLNNIMEQGRRPEQMEYSAKVSFYCILVAFLLAVTCSLIEPMFHHEFEHFAAIVKSYSHYH